MKCSRKQIKLIAARPQLTPAACVGVRSAFSRQISWRQADILSRRVERPSSCSSPKEVKCARKRTLYPLSVDPFPACVAAGSVYLIRRRVY